MYENKTISAEVLKASALFWWSVRDSNPRHHGCDPCALPAELTDRI